MGKTFPALPTTAKPEALYYTEEIGLGGANLLPCLQKRVSC